MSIAVGANGPRQLVEAFNAGDGTLTVTAAASATWLTPTVGGATSCTTRSGTCFPINIDLQTSSLTAGTQTGVVTVSAPNAIDAPQTITVTVLVGGGVPNKIDFFVAPNGSTDAVRFQTNSELGSNVTTQSGGSWLSLGIDGFGSFRFVWPYIAQARHISGLAEGTYNGAINITSSSFKPDVKSVPVTLQVTSNPIGRLAPERLQIRIAENSLKPEATVAVLNRGLGTLNITGVQATAASEGTWLTAQKAEAANVINVNIDTANLAPGKYQGTIEIASNAANGPLSVPVNLEVVAQGTPVAGFGGVVNNGIFKAGDTARRGRDRIRLWRSGFVPGSGRSSGDSTAGRTRRRDSEGEWRSRAALLRVLRPG